MIKITDVLITNECFEYLKKRNLTSQFIKAKQYLLSGEIKNTRFKERNPKGSWIFYFRINKQYRAIGYFDLKDLVIFKIDNHQ
jgi:plasmid maintenance system killer protein